MPDCIPADGTGRIKLAGTPCCSPCEFKISFDFNIDISEYTGPGWFGGYLVEALGTPVRVYPFEDSDTHLKWGSNFADPLDTGHTFANPGDFFGSWHTCTITFLWVNNVNVPSPGPLVINQTYQIVNYVAGDDFTNVGGTNTTGSVFTATGTTPANWSNGSTVNLYLWTYSLTVDSLSSAFDGWNWFNTSTIRFGSDGVFPSHRSIRNINVTLGKETFKPLGGGDVFDSFVGGCSVMGSILRCDDDTQSAYAEVNTLDTVKMKCCFRDVTEISVLTNSVSGSGSVNVCQCVVSDSGNCTGTAQRINYDDDFSNPNQFKLYFGATDSSINDPNICQLNFEFAPSYSGCSDVHSMPSGCSLIGGSGTSHSEWSAAPSVTITNNPDGTGTLNLGIGGGGLVGCGTGMPITDVCGITGGAGSNVNSIAFTQSVVGSGSVLTSNTTTYSGGCQYIGPGCGCVSPCDPTLICFGLPPCLPCTATLTVSASASIG